MTDIILHHYDRSPYAEAIRVALGFKGLSWRSVEIPMMGEKPELAPLTGGYRKTPVLQLGADIYCDTTRIAQALDERCEGPKLIPTHAQGLTQMAVQWAGSFMFRPAATLALGPVADALPQAFWDDRKALFGMDKDKMTALSPHLFDQWRAGAYHLAAALEDGRKFLLGDEATYADIISHIPIFFAGSTGNPKVQGVYKELPKLMAWFERLRAIGHGTRTEMTAQEALDIALEATPQTPQGEDTGDGRGFKIGDKVVILTEDPGATPVNGTVHTLGPNHIAIARHHDRVGDVVVNFPRTGIIVKPGKE